MALKLIHGGKTSNMEEVEDIMEEKVKVFKLSTGEEIIAKVTYVGQDSYKIRDPLLVVLRESNGSIGVELAPFFMAYANGDIVLLVGSIMAITDNFDERLLGNYKQFFSPIIQPPVQGISLT